MARQKGIIRITGTINGLNFYTRMNSDLVRASGGGFNSESSKKYPRIKENNTEMGNASKVNSKFKRSFRELQFGYKDGTLHYRLQSLFMSIKDLDEQSIRGQRQVHLGIATDYGKRLLKDFKFTPKRPMLLNGILDFDWNNFTLNVSQFNVQAVDMPESADLMGLELMAIDFDFEHLSYTNVRSSLLEIHRDFGDDSFSLQTPPLLSSQGIRFAMLRVAFYQQVNGINYLLKGAEGFGLGIVAME